MTKDMTANINTVHTDSQTMRSFFIYFNGGLSPPVLLFLLTLVRVANPGFLVRHSRYAILAIVG